MELDEPISLCKKNEKLPNFYGLRNEIIKKLEEYKKIKGEMNG